MGDAADVEAAGGDVGGDDDFELAAAEAEQRVGAVLLGDVAVHDGDLVFAFAA